MATDPTNELVQTLASIIVPLLLPVGDGGYQIVATDALGETLALRFIRGLNEAGYSIIKDGSTESV